MNSWVVKMKLEESLRRLWRLFVIPSPVSFSRLSFIVQKRVKEIEGFGDERISRISFSFMVSAAKSWSKGLMLSTSMPTGWSLIIQAAASSQWLILKWMSGCPNNCGFPWCPFVKTGISVIPYSLARPSLRSIYAATQRHWSCLFRYLRAYSLRSGLTWANPFSKSKLSMWSLM